MTTRCELFGRKSFALHNRWLVNRKIRHKDATDRLRHFTDRSNAVHRQYLDDPDFFAQYEYFVDWQIDYMRPFYADLLAKEDYAGALNFVISDLTGVGISKRDEDFARVVPVMVRMLPRKALATVASAMELNARVLEINVSICRALFQNGLPNNGISERDYIQACRSLSRLDESLALISLTGQVGDSLSRVIRIPLIGVTLRAMRSPARLAGFGDLQEFLETGYQTFIAIKNVEQFLSDIRDRMTEIFTRIYEIPLEDL